MGFKLKNVVKSVEKAAGQVAKVAVAPAAIVAASTLDSVGLRGAANKVIDKTALNKKIGTAEKKVGTYAGYGIDAVAVATVGAAVAPAIGHGLAVTGGVLKGVATPLLGAAKNFFSKKGSTTPSVADNTAPAPDGSILGDAVSAVSRGLDKAKHALHTPAGEALTAAVKTKAGHAIRQSGILGQPSEIQTPGTVQASTADALGFPAGLPAWVIPVAVAGFFVMTFIAGRKK